MLKKERTVYIAQRLFITLASHIEHMLKKRFFVAWGLSTVAMFIASYLWHGLLLNDLLKLSYPLPVFFFLAALAYLVVGFTLTFVFTYLSMGIGFRLKGSAMGAAMGFFIYLIAFVFGLSFNGHGLQHVVVDFLWQMIEQGIGGSVISVVYMLARRRDVVVGKVQ